MREEGNPVLPWTSDRFSGFARARLRAARPFSDRVERLGAHLRVIAGARVSTRRDVDRGRTPLPIPGPVRPTSPLRTGSPRPSHPQHGDAPKGLHPDKIIAAILAQP